MYKARLADSEGTKAFVQLVKQVHGRGAWCRMAGCMRTAGGGPAHAWHWLLQLAAHASSVQAQQQQQQQIFAAGSQAARQPQTWHACGRCGSHTPPAPC